MNQETALTLLKSGKNVFLTGQAGSGKTYVINQYIKHLRNCNIHVAITASTGIAATHIGGTTIHSRSGIGIKETLSEYDIELITTKEHIHKNIHPAKVLIIDEISMLSANTLDMIEKIVQAVKQDNRPFGGMQVIVVGDFFQLPPVQKFNSGESDTKRFSFASSARKNLDLAICYLHTQHRQNDADFSVILNQLRTGTPSKETITQLQSRLNADISHKPSLVKLYTHNVDVDRINQEQLDALDTDERIYRLTTKGDKKALESLKKNMLAPELLFLKIGAQVIFIKNNPLKGYRNGTTGIVVDFDNKNNRPIVQISPDLTITVEPESRSLEDKDEIIASVNQVPLKLARAITIHKSQGMTLDAAQIDLSKAFEAGQAYVALSRVRSLDGLSLVGLNTDALAAHPLVIRADNYFREQSEKIATDYDQLSHDEQHLIFSSFIQAIGGVYTTEKTSFTKEKTVRAKKLSPSSSKIKGQTYIETKILIEQGKNLAEVAAIRGLTQGTILGHILKLIKEFPDLDISAFKPDDELLQRVKDAMEHVEKDEENKIKLTPLHAYLGGNIGYDELRVALLFV